jgi:hypothetical protein
MLGDAGHNRRCRDIQGVCHRVSRAKIFCMSMHRWTVRSVSGPKGSVANAPPRLPTLTEQRVHNVYDRRELEWFAQECRVAAFRGL